MTLDELLAGYKTEHGDTWYLTVLDRLLYLHALPVWNAEDTEEYFLWKNWVKDAIAKSFDLEPDDTES